MGRCVSRLIDDDGIVGVDDDIVVTALGDDTPDDVVGEVAALVLNVVVVHLDSSVTLCVSVELHDTFVVVQKTVDSAELHGVVVVEKTVG